MDAHTVQSNVDARLPFCSPKCPHSRYHCLIDSSGTDTTMTAPIRARITLVLATVGMAGCPGRSLIPLDAGADAPISDIAADRSDATTPDTVDAANDAVDATDTVDPIDAVDVVDAAPDVAMLDAAIDAAADGTDAADAFDASSADAVDVTSSDADNSDGTGTVWTPFGDGGCNARVRATPLQPAIHVDPDAGPIAWFTNPPSSGPHYPIWAHWGAFPNIPPGYWVHNLEHGGVVMLYSCPSGTCSSTVDALQAAADTIPTDRACMPSDASPTRVRVVITNYDPLDAPIQASAWGWLYAADCVDPTSLREFYAAHGGMGPEDFCADGYYP